MVGCNDEISSGGLTPAQIDVSDDEVSTGVRAAGTVSGASSSLSLDERKKQETNKHH